MVEKLLTNSHVWYCTTDGYWCLGVRHDDRLTSIIARVLRRKDGNHEWRISNLPFIEGIEPSRDEAMRAVARIFIDKIPTEILDFNAE